jgi:hypothetical protein
MARRFNLSWQRWSAADVNQLRRFAAAGMTMKGAADAIGRAHCAVKCKAMREGISFPRKGWRQPGPGREPDHPLLKVIEGSERLRNAIMEASRG